MSGDIANALLAISEKIDAAAIQQGKTVKPWEDRREAGFTEQELDELREITADGPSRDTMREAARQLRERHHARRAASAERASA